MHLHGACIIWNRRSIDGSRTAARYIIPIALTEPVYHNQYQSAPNGGVKIHHYEAGLGFLANPLIRMLPGAVDRLASDEPVTFVRLSTVCSRHGSVVAYPLDGVVFTTGCDKTTPAALMAAATTDLPSIIFNGGPMLNSFLDGASAGAGTIIWEARRRLSAGEIDEHAFMKLLEGSSPSPGHCNVMGTALSMNCLAEAMGMAMPGTASIPASYRERLQAGFDSGTRIVQMVHEDLRPSEILNRNSLLNAVRVNTAIGGSTNCPPHLSVIAKHAGIELSMQDWETYGYDIPLLVNLQPAGTELGEDFHRVGGLPTVMRTLGQGGLLEETCLTVSGKSIGENIKDAPPPDGAIIRTTNSPLREKAGFLDLSGNLFDSALMKTSVISSDFRQRFLSRSDNQDCFESRVVVFDGPEDYHQRLNDPALGIDESTMLVVRGCGTIGFPGSGEVVNMQPPDSLLKVWVRELPTMGDGRQSGTSASPSILNASPEAYAGGGLAKLRTGDRVLIDLKTRRVDALVDVNEWNARDTSAWESPPTNLTPWQKIYRDHVGQLHFGGCLDFACAFRNVCGDVPRHNH